MMPAVLLLVIAVAYRVVLGMAGSHDHQWLHNFAPVAAIALCGAAYLPKRLGALLPLGILFVSDVILNVFCYHQPLLTWEILPRYVALGLISLLGFALRGRVRLAGLLSASFVGSIVFYLVTNTGSWLGEPAYAKSLSGWIQALTTGLPGYPPTWMFYRHTMMSDLLFTAIFSGCMAFRPAEEPAEEKAEEEEEASAAA